MSALGDRLRAMAAGQKPPPKPATPLQTALTLEEPKNPFTWGQRPPVAYSKDLDRILNLPRRPSDYELIAPPEVTARVSDELRRPGGTRELRAIQAASLTEARDVRGLLAPIGVGAGKTDISVLLPTVLGSRVAVLLVPPALKKKLIDVEYPYLQTQWRLPNLAGARVVYPDTECILHVVSYSQLSIASGTGILEQLNPDLIVADEVHNLAGASARRKRFDRYMKKNEHVLFCGMSGTISGKSIKDYAHLAKYAFRQRSPLPLHWPTLDEWSAVIDPVKGDLVHPPGELVRLCKPGESVRAAFGRRLVETKGVVATKENHIPTALTLSQRPLKVPQHVEDMLQALRADWDSPDGEPISDALTVSRYGRQLASGLYTVWEWPAKVPEALKKEWLNHRRAWNKEVRDMLKGNAKEGMDSPLLLALAARSGKWNSLALDGWTRVAKKYRALTGKREPPTRTVWVDDFMVDDAVKWGKQPGIIWYEHADLGRRIAEKGGFVQYGPAESAPKGIDPKTGQEVPAIVLEDGSRTIVASILSWGTGWNLQAYHRMLYTSCPSDAKLMEQSLGRCHRSLQEADEVTADFYLHTPEMQESYRTAVIKAQYAQDTLKTSQKLLYATKTFTLTPSSE